MLNREILTLQHRRFNSFLKDFKFLNVVTNVLVHNNLSLIEFARGQMKSSAQSDCEFVGN